VAGDGAEALGVFEAERPDVVLTDLRMPVMDGLALVRALHEVSPETPIIVISGTGNTREAVSAIRDGAWDFILKPVEHIAELEMAISRNVERARLLAANRQHQVDLESLVAERTSELREREAQVLRMQRQESLGRLASGIAHDLNNVLAPIMMAGDLLQTAALNENERECVEMVRASSARGADMVRQLLLFSRGADGRRAKLDPSRIVRDVARMITETFPKDIQVRLEMPSTACLVEADATQLHQVVLNLCVNARDAMPHGGTLSMTLERVEIDGESAELHPPAQAGPYVVFIVADSGTGIAPDIVDKIFDPFFTTKPAGQGTGLGLSTVQGIVASHGGFVDVQSRPGSGTAFRVYLPHAAGAEADDAASSADGDAPRGAGQTILVVDDERMVRSLIKRTLQDYGYRVLVAEGGAQALNVFDSSPDPVDLVMVDMWMPHMDGATTIRRLARRDPNTRVIAMSGLSEMRDQVLRSSPVVKRFIVKPWRTKDLLTTIDDVVNTTVPRPAPRIEV
jgi:signal transduction histidine kinase